MIFREESCNKCDILVDQLKNFEKYNDYEKEGNVLKVNLDKLGENRRNKVKKILEGYSIGAHPHPHLFVYKNWVEENLPSSNGSGYTNEHLKSKFSCTKRTCP